MYTENDVTKVVPAQLSFLAIYNPTFSDSEDTTRDQIVYYYSKSQRDRDITNQKGQAIKDQDEVDDSKTEQRKKQEENERLRQVGLAQGMVDFVKNFSNGVPVDSIETDKSRIVLHELERNWWILASIDLTRLPAAKATTVSGDTTKAAIEYSSREVSPPQLLLKQLIRAHSVFLLHHASNLWALYNRLGRDNFCGVLERYWNRFTWDWDVLLHGNPLVDIYGGIKLAGGGELGIGVGEEEWGSGEREVLEGFLERTEGLIDLVVGRYGDAPIEVNKNGAGSSNTILEPESWLGVGEPALPSDGIVFSGIGGLSRRSIATISHWMEDIFKDGEAAYGVAENPTARPRRKKKRRREAKMESKDGKPAKQTREGGQSSVQQTGGRHSDLRRKAIENSASPGIPAPLVGTIERSFEDAVAKIERRESSQNLKHGKANEESSTDQQSLFDTEKMMKYLSLGYGTSWTLNPKGFGTSNEGKTDRTTVGNQETSHLSEGNSKDSMQHMDPMPETEEEEETPFRQRLEQSMGKFLIGLSGDLENAEFEGDSEDEENDESAPTPKPHRIFLRTLTVEFNRPRFRRPSNASRARSKDSHASARSLASNEEKTSAAASVDGAQTITKYERVQVTVYVHQPFIFIFLFELHTSSLTMPAFYRGIHHQLGPLQKSLLRSTDPARVAEHIAQIMRERNPSSPTNDNSKLFNHQPIYDLIYDPTKLTVRTSIPNIPIPGTLAAEGLTTQPAISDSISGSWYTLGIPIGPSASSRSSQDKLHKSDWTRIDALNVHIQALNIWTATRSNIDQSLTNERERTVKTTRAWWLVWMQVQPPQPTTSAEHEDETTSDGPTKEAFLVRKSADRQHSHSSNQSAGKQSGSSGRWLLREQARDEHSGSSSRRGDGSNSKGVAEGVGVDARKWVESLVKLSL